MEQEKINLVFEKYYKLVNMNYSELLEWSKNPASRLASLSREPIKRNLRILKLNKDEWTSNTVKSALRTISYLSRATKIKSKNLSGYKDYTRNEIALKNWAYDVLKY